MRYLVWILRLAIFVIVLLFALKNTALVDVGLFGGRIVHQIPLIVVMLAAFVLGLAFGLLVAATTLFRRRREINRLRRELGRAQESLSQVRVVNPPLIRETAVPLAPL